VFEPTYLNLSTSVIQAGLRSQTSMAPMAFAIAALVLALITLLAGTTADLFGRRLLLMAGLVGLMASNVLGLFWLDTPKWFAIADSLNAVSGVIVLPAAVAIVTLAFEPALRPFAYAVLFATQGTALVVGMLLVPMLGGVWGGRAAFIPVLILGVWAIVLALRHVPESRAPKSVRRGTAILNLVLVAGLFLIIFLVVTGTIRSEQYALVLAIAVGLLLLAALVRWVARRLRHFKGLEVYSRRDLALAVFAGVMIMFGQGCFFYQITPYFYDVQQVGAVEGALRFVPYVIGLLAGSALIARLALRFGARRVLALSFALSGLGLLALAFLKVDTPFWVMIVPTTLIGLATGLSGPARTQVVMSAPPEGLVNGSAAVNTAAGQAGYSLGVIVSSVLVTRYADRLFLDALAAAGVPAETLSRLSAALQNVVARLLAAGYPELPEAATVATSVQYANAFTSGMTVAFFLASLVMFVTALVMLLGMHRGLAAAMIVPPDVAGDEAGASVVEPPAGGPVSAGGEH
jgi:MFS family permease